MSEKGKEADKSYRQRRQIIFMIDKTVIASSVINEDGDSEFESMNTIEDDETNFGTRVRQYGSDNNGPFVVCVRTNNKNQPLESMAITRFVRSRFPKSNIEVRQVNRDKLMVTFSPKTTADSARNAARDEANTFPNCEEWCQKFGIYIPELMVETIGVINLSVKDDEKELLTTVSGAFGRFENNRMPAVKILEAVRFTKSTDEAPNPPLAPNRTKLGTVRVTFDGLLLPEYIIMDGLRIPVRSFRRRKMFCDACKRYNHTSSHCVNKPREATAQDFKCNHCKSNDHEEGGKICPRRKILEKRENSLVNNVQKKTFAEMLQRLDPDATLPGEKEKEYNQNFPLQLGTKRQRNMNQASTSKSASGQESPVKKYQRDKDGNRNSAREETNGPPPGFKLQNESSQEDDDITKFLKTFVNDLGLPPFITQLIVKFVIPVVNNFISQITNSLLEKCSQLAQC